MPNYRPEPIWAAMMPVNFLARSCVHRSPQRDRGRMPITVAGFCWTTLWCVQLFYESPVLAGQHAVGLLEPAAKMGHVGKSPAVGDFAHAPVRLKRIFQRLAAARKASRLNETYDRR